MIQGKGIRQEKREVYILQKECLKKDTKVPSWCKRDNVYPSSETIVFEDEEE